MGIEASYRRVTPLEWDALISHPETADAFFGHDLLDLADADLGEALFSRLQALEASGRYLDLDKDWHALHFLLTGESSLLGVTRTPPPLGNIVMGGTDTPFDCTYGKVRVLTPNEVKDVADALGSIPVEGLEARLDPVAFNEARIYPNPMPGGWDRVELESLLEIYPQLVRFFQNAADQGDLILLSFD
ncbi:MAG: YfbM family protein [Isosphaeraceae bacterium]